MTARANHWHKSGRGPSNTADSAHVIRGVTSDMAGILFEDIFDVKDIDPDGKKFERGISGFILVSIS